MEAKDAGEGKDAGDAKAAASTDAPAPGLGAAADDELAREYDVKIILLGDSAVGKSKLVERYMMGDYNPRQLSTYALNTFQKTEEVDDKNVKVEFWDTAGQERFQKIHQAYYNDASACLLVFDVTRKATYQHLPIWYEELRNSCGKIPCILVANKIDVNYKVTKKNFKFAADNNLPFFFVSAADGTNVVQVFKQAVEEAVRHRDYVKAKIAAGEYDDDGGDLQFIDDVRDTLRYFDAKEEKEAPSTEPPQS